MTKLFFSTPMYDEAELTKLNDGNLDSVTESHLSKPRRKYVHRAVRIFIICFHHLAMRILFRLRCVFCVFFCTPKRQEAHAEPHKARWYPSTS